MVRTLCGLCVFLCCGTVAAQPKHSLLDLIPEDSPMSFGVKNFNQAVKKLDLFLQNAGAPPQMRAGNIVGMVNQELGLQGVLNLNGNGAFVFIAPQALGYKTLFQGESVVGVIPVTSAEAAAKALGVDAKKFKSGKILRGKLRMSSPLWTTYYRNHMLISEKDIALRVYLKGKRLRKSIPKDRLAEHEAADALWVVRPSLFGLEWDLAVNEISQLAKGDPRNLDTKLALLAKPLLSRFERGLFAFSIDKAGKNFSAKATALFKNDLLTRTAIAAFGANALADKDACSLKMLPKGDVLFAQAAAFPPTLPRDFGRLALAPLILNRNRRAFDFSDRSGIFDQIGSNLVSGMMAELFGQFKNERIGLYMNSDSRNGAFAMIAIAEPRDAAKLLKTLSEMSTTNPKIVLTKSGPAPIDKAAVQSALKRLGSEKFLERRKAQAELARMGQLALPYVREAMSAADSEVAARAKTIYRQLSRARAKHTRGVFQEQGWLARFTPEFGFHSRIEKRAETTIHGISLSLAKVTSRDVLSFQYRSRRGIEKGIRDEPKGDPLNCQPGSAKDMSKQIGEFDTKRRKQLVRLLGPDWQTLRLALVKDKSGKQRAVMMWGSQLDLFEKAIANVRGGVAGLEKSPAFASFATGSAPGRSLQVHFAIDTITRLAAGPDKKLPELEGPSRSTALTIRLQPKSASVQAELLLPAAELKALLSLAGPGAFLPFF